MSILTLIRKIFTRLAFIIERYQSRKKTKYSDAQFDIQRKRVEKWYADEDHQNRRFNYQLNADSVVFDLGGYKGEFAMEIYCRYKSMLYIFEPVKNFCEHIQNQFSHNDDIRVFRYGLGRSNYKTNISLNENASSILGAGNAQGEEIEIRSFNDFIEQNNIRQIDLMKVNIEGAEYELLESILDAGNMHKIVNLQVQFHDFVVANAYERMKAIHQKLSLTHELTWYYEFVWDNWRLKNV